MDERPRFLADEMLGTLVKWLRIMGYDTSYAKDMKDGEIAALAMREGRSLLTRDKALAKTVGCSGLYVVSDVIEEQVAQVARSLWADLRCVQYQVRFVQWGTKAHPPGRGAERGPCSLLRHDRPLLPLSRLLQALLGGHALEQDQGEDEGLRALGELLSVEVLAQRPAGASIYDHHAANPLDAP